MIFKETLIKSLSFAVRDSRSPTCAAHLSAFLSCLSYRQCPIRSFGAPSPRGEGCDARIPSSKKRRRSRHLNPEPNESKVKRTNHVNDWFLPWSDWWLVTGILWHRHPERSRGIFTALRESACMHRGKTMSWCCLTSGDEHSAIKIEGYARNDDEAPHLLRPTRRTYRTR